MDASTLRQKVLAERDALPEEVLIRLSRQAEKNLNSVAAYHRSQFPLFFISFRSEISTHALIKQRLAAGLPVLVPKSIISKRRLEIYRIYDWERDLETGAYGIPEPLPGIAEKIQDPSVIDLVLVPGSVFDQKCGRYGYGGGFYDRFLAEHAINAVRTGMAFHFQIMEHIPLAPHDERMDIIVTDREILNCGL